MYNVINKVKGLNNHDENNLSCPLERKLILSLENVIS